MCVLKLKLDSCKEKLISSIKIMSAIVLALRDNTRQAFYFLTGAYTNGSPWTGEPLGSVAAPSSEAMHFRVRSLLGIAE